MRAHLTRQLEPVCADEPPVPQPAAQPEKPGAAVAEPPAKREVKPAPPRVDELPKFKVLLHNDDVNSFEHVIETIVTLTPHPLNMARKLTLEAHLRGLSLLLVTHKERAELYRDQFHSRQLTVSIEPE